MHFYIHIPLPEELKNKIEAFRLRYNWPAKSEPHITLVPPLKLLDGHTGLEMVRAVELVAKKTNPFRITQKGAGYFGYKEIINIGVERTNDILLLHRDLLEVISGILEPSQGEFADLPNPHITVVSLPSDKGGELWEEIKNEDFSGEFLCDKITLLRRGDDEKKWAVVQNFVFGV
ncbi:MAG: 2'-5' RNA ligase family protein [bacterium]|nr:2'-5' RNA ligase family protein [bacterium]